MPTSTLSKNCSETVYKTLEIGIKCCMHARNMLGKRKEDD